MYVELGGYTGYMQTPVRELQEIRLSIIAEMVVQAEQEAKLKEEQAEMKREMERQKMRGR